MVGCTRCNGLVGCTFMLVGYAFLAGYLLVGCTFWLGICWLDAQDWVFAGWLAARFTILAGWLHICIHAHFFRFVSLLHCILVYWCISCMPFYSLFSRFIFFLSSLDFRLELRQQHSIWQQHRQQWQVDIVIVIVKLENAHVQPAAAWTCSWATRGWLESIGVAVSVSVNILVGCASIGTLTRRNQ